MNLPQPDLAGIYITDNAIDVIVGRDLEPSRHKLSVLQLRLDEDVDPQGTRMTFPVRDHKATGPVLDQVVEWIAERAPKVKAVGVAGYGPFRSVDESDKDSPLYGQIVNASERPFAGKNLRKLIGARLETRLKRQVILDVTADVTAAAMGIAYRHRKANALKPRPEEIGDRVFVFIKVSIGIGGAFMRPRTRWSARLHPEMGQMRVPLWPGDHEWLARRQSQAWNDTTVEGLANIPALASRYPGENWEGLLSDPAHEAWKREAWYLAHMAWNISTILSPHQIIFGGRMLAVPGLTDQIRDSFVEHAARGAAGFKFLGIRKASLDGYLQAIGRAGPTSIDRPGIVGTLALAAMRSQRPAIRRYPDGEQL